MFPEDTWQQGLENPSVPTGDRSQRKAQLFSQLFKRLLARKSFRICLQQIHPPGLPSACSPVLLPIHKHAHDSVPNIPTSFTPPEDSQSDLPKIQDCSKSLDCSFLAWAIPGGPVK